ncbi:MAG: hypothetical protein U5K56_18125 [Halioglobus sp.]|nr:hypothetical protein [Halioglobus sp.]
MGYGFTSATDHELDLDWRRLATEDTGTPSLPMDIDWFDTDLWNLRYTPRIGGYRPGVLVSTARTSITA